MYPLHPPNSRRVSENSEIHHRYLKRTLVSLTRNTSDGIERDADASTYLTPAACVLARLLATSAGQRARLMLPTGLLSGVELPVTSK